MKHAHLKTPSADRCLLLIVMGLALLYAGSAAGHRLRPAIVTIHIDDAGSYTGEIDLNLEAVLAGIGPEHQDTSEAPQAAEYDALRELPTVQLRQAFEGFKGRYLAGINLSVDGQRLHPKLVSLEIPPVGDVSVERLTRITLAGTLPTGGKQLTWSYAPEFGESALRIAAAGQGVIRAEWLTAGQSSEAFPLNKNRIASRSTWDVFIDYTGLGFTHILPKGLDHMLFVLGIFLLSLKWRPLLYQVTAFTLAHSITLGLSLYGLISLPASIVEPLIALSIVYIAVENIFTAALKPWRVWIVFGFGLLHGLGFAGVLTELGLPRGEFLTALIGFNIGVELGQLAVIALAFLAVGIWFREQPWYRRAIVLPGSVLIAMIGSYWFVERIAG